jgi:hypothetical protein
MTAKDCKTSESAKNSLVQAKKPPIVISFDISNNTYFTEVDRNTFQETIIKILKGAVANTAKNVSENMLFLEFQQTVKRYSKIANSDEDARRMAMEAMTLSILLNNLKF